MWTHNLCINFVNYVRGTSWNIVLRKKKELGLRVEGNLSPLPRIICAVFAFCHRYNVDGQNITYNKLLPFCLSTTETFYIFTWDWMKISHISFMISWHQLNILLLVCLLVCCCCFFFFADGLPKSQLNLNKMPRN